MEMTLGRKVRDTSALFEFAGIDTARLDAEILICEALALSRISIITEDSKLLSPEDIAKVDELILRRMKRVPVAYILGEKEFYGLNLRVCPDVLIPRPETEISVDQAIYFAPYNSRVLDLCTGSGAIAIALKYNRRDLKIVAADISSAALECAKLNSDEILGEGEIEFLQGDLFEPVSGLFSLICVNPPYVSPSFEKNAAPELGYEPQIALYSEDDGLSHIRRIVEAAPRFLEKNGILIMEIGFDQKDAVISLGGKNFFKVTVCNDYSGNPRVARFEFLG